MKHESRHSKKNFDPKFFLDYLKGRLSVDEQHRFERSVMSDPFDADAYDGLSQLSPEAFDADMTALQQLLHKTTQKRKPWLWISAAASLALLIGLVSLLFILIPAQQDRRIAALKPTANDTAMIQKQLPAKPQSERQPKPEQPEPAEQESPAATEVPVPIEVDVINYFSDEELESEITESESGTKSGENQTGEKINQAKTEAPLSNKKAEATPSAPAIRIRGISKLRNQPLPDSLQSTSLEGTISGTDVQYNGEPLIVKGYVLDESHNPLPGVSIIQLKTGNNTLSNINGYFEMALPAYTAGDTSLLASFIGYETYQFSPKNDTTVINLKPEMLALEEVVVTGYGAASNEPSTGYIPAKPTGGLIDYRQRISEKIKALNIPIDEAFRVVVKLTIDHAGSIKSVEVLKSPYPTYNQEIINIIKNSERWTPASQNGQPVSSTVRINFRVRN